MSLWSHRRSQTNLTLNDVFSRLKPFSGVITKQAAPWSGDDTTSDAGLDLAYLAMRSGKKFASNFLVSLIDNTGSIPPSKSTELLEGVRSLYFPKWSHLWGLYATEYSPLNSVNVSDTASKTVSRQYSDSIDGSRTGHDSFDENATRTDNLEEGFTEGSQSNEGGTDTVTTTPQGSDRTVSSVYADNTSVPEPHDESVTTQGIVTTEATQYGRTNAADISRTKTNTGTQSNVRSNELSKEEGYDEDKTGSSTESETVSRIRRGNDAGAPAELMTKDREYWRESFFDIVFADLDALFALSLYSDSDPINLHF